MWSFLGQGWLGTIVYLSVISKTIWQIQDRISGYYKSNFGSNVSTTVASLNWNKMFMLNKVFKWEKNIFPNECPDKEQIRLRNKIRNEKQKRLYGFEANISSSINILFLKRFFRRNIQNSWFKNITRSLMHCRGQFMKKKITFFTERRPIFLNI